MQLLAGKVAFITGAGSGIGEGAAMRFAEEGASIAVSDVNEEDGRRVVAAIEKGGGKALFVRCDVSDPEQVRQAIDQAVKSLGKLDIVFANAGINGVWTPIEELQPQEWDRTLDINLKGTYLTVHFAISHLRRNQGGSIIITSSVNGTRTFSNAGASAYSTSKAGQIAFMMMAALELGRYNIRVNAVCPGAISTNIDESTKKRNVERIAIKCEMEGASPFINQGYGEPRDVADTCLFLASDLSRHVSGVQILVDGGASLF
jgi:NAD(P)-dependent dehydrogenase (short-subunit alcohol dehydrogenase family)